MTVYEMSGTVTFSFVDVVVEEDDPFEAIHEVEMMTTCDLLDYADDVATVTVDRQRVIA